MRLAGAEEPGHPDSRIASRRGVSGTVEAGGPGAEEGAEVAAQLTRDDVFVQFLEDRGGVVLVGVDDTVDRTGHVLDEKVLDEHGSRLGGLWEALGVPECFRGPV